MVNRDKPITKSFTWGEFIREGDNPNADILFQIQILANRLQVVRDLLGLPIHITSGYRNPTHNAAVGGAKNSYHVKGMAADIIVTGMPARALQAYLKNWSGGMGRYPDFTHLDVGPERRW